MWGAGGTGQPWVSPRAVAGGYCLVSPNNDLSVEAIQVPGKLRCCYGCLAPCISCRRAGSRPLAVEQYGCPLPMPSRLGPQGLPLPACAKDSDHLFLCASHCFPA